MTKGQIRIMARRFLRHEPIPLFWDVETNRAINAEIDRLLRRQTFRRKVNWTWCLTGHSKTVFLYANLECLLDKPRFLW